MNTYKDKLADENAAHIESPISKAVSKQGDDQQPPRETHDNNANEMANDKIEEVSTGTHSEDTLKARVPYGSITRARRSGPKTKARKRLRSPSSSHTKKGWPIRGNRRNKKKS